MKVKWLGHAAFLITASDGTRVITDPYEPGDRLTYAPISESAQIVTVSHRHGDHNNVDAVKGNPMVVNSLESRKIKGIEIKGIATYHDTDKGAQRGENIIFCVTVDDVRVAHLGDLGHVLSEEQIREVVPVDVLLIPVGGLYTIDGRAASQVAEALVARIVIPMHFRTARCGFPIADAEPFLKGRANVRKIDGSEVEFTKESLHEATETVVLKPAL